MYTLLVNMNNLIETQPTMMWWTHDFVFVPCNLHPHLLFCLARPDPTNQGFPEKQRRRSYGSLKTTGYGILNFRRCSWCFEDTPFRCWTRETRIEIEWGRVRQVIWSGRAQTRGNVNLLSRAIDAISIPKLMLVPSTKISRE